MVYGKGIGLAAHKADPHSGADGSNSDTLLSYKPLVALKKEKVRRKSLTCGFDGGRYRI